VIGRTSLRVSLGIPPRSDGQYMDPKHEVIVWIVDSEQWPRACLRAELIERGYDAVGFEKIERALDAIQAPDSHKPRAIVLELRDQVITSSALKSLADSKIPVIALAGALELNNPPVRDFTWAAVLSRPFALGNVADAVERILTDS
jgi:DNA-binding NtrC family response regulator